MLAMYTIVSCLSCGLCIGVPTFCQCDQIVRFVSIWATFERYRRLTFGPTLGNFLLYFWPKLVVLSTGLAHNIGICGTIWATFAFEWATYSNAWPVSRLE